MSNGRRAAWGGAAIFQCAQAKRVTAIFISAFRRPMTMSSRHNSLSRLFAVFALATLALATAAEAQPYGQGQGGGGMMSGGWGWGMGYGMDGFGGIGVLVLALVVLGLAVMAFRRRSP